jgi:uncharacterized membrane protein
MLIMLGILIVAAGFALRLNALLTVLVAGIVTGLLAGYSLNGILALLGQFFVDNRFMTLPVILMLPVVGLLERYGLQEQAASAIRRAGAATAGRVLFSYQALREFTSMLGISVGNHASMVRPLIAPMAEGAAAARHGVLRPEHVMCIRAHAAAAENLGNFFADDILVAVGPVLLMKGVFDLAGVPVEILTLAWWALPTALWVLLVGVWRYRRLDRLIALEVPAVIAAGMAPDQTNTAATAALPRIAEGPGRDAL